MLKNSFFYRFIVAVKRSISVAKILFYRQGLFRSMFKGIPLGKNGEPIPWFTYPAIEYLKQFDFSQKKVFEYGSGNSSIFWASRAMQVTAVESNRQWYEHVLRFSRHNLVLMLEPDRESYISSIGRYQGTFDVIVIDGQWRNACADVCKEYLAEDGIIIIDNSDRKYACCTKLRENGFFQIDFSGFSPVNGYTSTTSIFIRTSNKLQLNFLPSSPVGGLAQVASEDD